MPESMFYEKGGVRITKCLFEVNTTQYQIRNINTVAIDKENPNRKGPIVCIVIGVFLLAAYGLGLLIIGLGIWWWISQKPIYRLALDTSSGRVQGVSSQSFDEIAEIRSALNAAMEQR
jgi:hypothetical protein